MPATDALLARTEFAEAGTTTSTRTHLERMAEAFTDEADNNALSHTNPAQMVDTWLRSVAVAEAFYVHPLMRDVVTAAAATMPDENLVPEDLPSPHGFVLIPGGVGQVDQFGRLIMVNAVLWSTLWRPGAAVDAHRQVRPQ